MFGIFFETRKNRERTGSSSDSNDAFHFLASEFYMKEKIEKKLYSKYNNKGNDCYTTKMTMKIFFVFKTSNRFLVMVIFMYFGDQMFHSSVCLYDFYLKNIISLTILKVEKIINEE